MGRPKKEDAEIRCLDVRLTPSNQQPIDFTKLDLSDYQKFLVGKEGGTGTGKQLHYHCYIETRRSDFYLKTQYQALTGGMGNKAYSQRKAHEGTLGYCVKDGDVVLQHGYTEDEVKGFKERSAQYRTEKETERKRSVRAKDNLLKGYVMEVIEELEQYSNPSPHYIMSLFLQKYDRDDARFPSRSTLETAVLTILYRFSPSQVVEYYTKNINPSNPYEVSYRETEPQHWETSSIRGARGR